MWWDLEYAVREVADKKIRRHESYRRSVVDENVRRQRRSLGMPARVDARRPHLWDVSPGHDPYHVKKQAASIAHAVAKKLKDGNFAPRTPYVFAVPKPNGGSRLVTSFAIVDEVISSRVYNSLLRKNRPISSARSYAYKNDRGIHDAISYMRSEWRTYVRLFVAEYDFTSFFDSIEHAHLWDTMESMRFVATDLERSLLRCFAESGTHDLRTGSIAPRVRGIPMGTSASLFLANLAASPLDRSLERLGVGFVRYADDTVVWANSYPSICRAVDELYRAAESIGSPINQDKSAGIRLLVGRDVQRAELVFTPEIDYLGHTISLNGARIRKRSMDQIRDHITLLIYNNLLREVLAGTQDLSRLTTVDRDYVSYIWQLRRYLYGQLNENEVRRFGGGVLPPVPLAGVLARYPLVDEMDSLVELDSWLATQTWLAVAKRSRLLQGRPGIGPTPEPWNRTRSELIRLQTKSGRTGEPVDLRLPSAVRMAGVVRRAFQTHGSAVVSPGAPLYGSAGK